MKNFRLSPALFLVLEFIILIPSILFILGVLQWFIFRSSFLLLTVTPNKALLQNILVTIVSPFAGGFLAYHYLERYKPKGYIALKAKGIIFYSIMQIGLVLTYLVLENFPH